MPNIHITKKATKQLYFMSTWSLGIYPRMPLTSKNPNKSHWYNYCATIGYKKFLWSDQETDLITWHNYVRWLIFETGVTWNDFEEHFQICYWPSKPKHLQNYFSYIRERNGRLKFKKTITENFVFISFTHILPAFHL
jgi:hypothetical protein